MKITQLKLINYRNYDNLNLHFSDGVNAIVGKNGSGKTNLVEAIQYLSQANSFRGVDDIELLKHGFEFSQIGAEIEQGGIKRNVLVNISKQGKSILINGKRINKLSSLYNLFNAIVFEPSDVLFFKDSPAKRRKFLNISLSKQSELYLQNLMVYEKLLKERNEILKCEKIDMQLLDIVTEQLIQAAIPLTRERALYVSKINSVLNKIVPHLTDENKRLELRYTPFASLEGDFEKNASNELKRAKDSDFKRKSTGVGPHREDITMLLNGKEIATYGSQGENRLAALALIFSPYFLEDDLDKRPVIILDDVMSELDEKHQTKLIAFVKKLNQVFITATSIHLDGATYYEASNNTIKRRYS